ncbi:TetR/AcrR family transcriptional regulator [Actinospongicola halichondriae]|uniref:TetR/AcrR family transcriptional regulator n=1 Tax=Actinospongicola halichondriae TaxID=3236844 RepID=UPI003D54CE63
MATQALDAADGRRARRDRNRASVIDALFDLLVDGSFPTTEAIAERAGVSVSSVFRYFESLDDLQRQTIDAHFDRFGPLFDVPSPGEGDTAERIQRFVDARLALYEAVAPVARLARARAYDQPLIAERLTEVRKSFVRQIRDHFAAELEALSPARAEDTAHLVDASTSFETWDLLSTTHDRTGRQIRRAWIDGIAALL